MPFPFVSCPSVSLLWFAASAAATHYSPRGGRSRRRRREGWNCIGTVRLQGEDYLADVLAVVDEAEGEGTLLQGDLRGDHGAQLAARDPLLERLDVLVERPLRIPEREHVQADEPARALHHRERVEDRCAGEHLRHLRDAASLAAAHGRGADADHPAAGAEERPALAEARPSHS